MRPTTDHVTMKNPLSGEELVFIVKDHLIQTKIAATVIGFLRLSRGITILLGIICGIYLANAGLHFVARDIKEGVDNLLLFVLSIALIINVRGNLASSAGNKLSCLLIVGLLTGGVQVKNPEESESEDE